MADCSHCGAHVDDGVSFCSACGTRVDGQAQPSFCRNCGAKLPDGAAFCPACGASRSGAANPTPCPQTPANPVNVSDWLFLSILSTIFSFPIGLGALAFSLMARYSARRGAEAEAQSFAEVARIWNIVIWAFLLGGFLIFGLAALLMAIFGVGFSFFTMGM